MPTPSDAISTYIHAKDGNRPYLMRRAFAETVALEMVVKTDAISFPAAAKGLDAITGILVHRFARDFENVYTFCLTSPAPSDIRWFSCGWLVGMSSREGGAIRVGCGRYDWFFQSGDRGLVDKLKIIIERMQVLPPDHLDPVMSWRSPTCPIRGVRPPQRPGACRSFQSLWRSRITSIAIPRKPAPAMRRQPAAPALPDPANFTAL